MTEVEYFMSFVKLEICDEIAVVTIDREKALNALNKKVLKDLDDVFKSIDVDQVRVVVLTGAGKKAFVAGADIAEMREMSFLESKEFSKFGNGIFRGIELFPVPVIAAINGFALGGGNELAMSCDIRICSENALFGQPETSLGIIPGFGGTQRLVKVMGSLSRAKELIYTGKTIGAQEALRLGLVSAVYKQEELLDRALEMAGLIAANAPIAVKNSKYAVNYGGEMAVEDGLDIEAIEFAQCFETADHLEGMNAFLEKRSEKNFTNK